MRGLAVGAVALGLVLTAVSPAMAADSCSNADLRTGDSAGLADCRAYELVSPAYKPAGIGVGFVYRGFGDLANTGFPALEGDRFAAMGQYGSTLVDDEVALVNNWAFAQRADVGWTSHSPMTHALQERQRVRISNILSASDDVSRVVFSSNLGGLAIFPELIGGALGVPAFIVDWEGRWELFGPTHPSQLASSSPPPDVVISGDGSVALGWGQVWGLAGTDAPDHPAWPDRAALSANARGRSVYVADVSGVPADNFADTGERELVNVCTGAGAARTAIPERRADGKLDAQECPAPLEGRSSRMVSHYGAFTSVAGPSNVADDPLKNIVSRDGRRVFFMAPDPLVNALSNPGAVECSTATGEDTLCPTQLYVRQTGPDGSNPTVRWVSRPEDGLLGEQDASLLGQAFFEGATPDGDKVFFRSSSPLTADDPNGGVPVPGGVKTGADSLSSWDLFMYDFPDDPAADPGDGQLTRVSGGPGGAGDCNNFQPAPGPFTPLSSNKAGTLRFASDDGSRVYFVCSAPLPGVPPSSNGTTTAPGGTPASTDFTNLYLWDANRPAGDQYRFVARLPRSTSAAGALSRCASTGQYDAQPLSGSGAFSQASAHKGNCVRGTGDGEFVTFFTDGGLVAGDDAASGDVYGYDAIADRLVRLSEPPPGAGSYTCVSGSAPPAGAQCFGDPGFNVIEERQPASWLGVATEPDLFGDSRVAFFQSRSRLLPEDVNDVYDVYRWRDGVLSLVSTGAADAEPTIYKGNDRTGRNVYLATRESLTWQDTDAVADIYVARVGGGIPEPPPPPACAVLAGACRPGAAPIEGVGSPPTAGPGGGDASERRRRLSVRPPGARQRRLAARRGVLALRVRTTAPGRLRAVARARVGRRARVVGRTSRRLAEPGRAIVRLRLSRPARRALRSGRRLRVKVVVKLQGAPPRRLAVALRRADR